eukprot:1988017-Amphidinium_carterae.1
MEGGPALKHEGHLDSKRYQHFVAGLHGMSKTMQGAAKQNRQRKPRLKDNAAIECVLLALPLNSVKLMTEGPRQRQA